MAAGFYDRLAFFLGWKSSAPAAAVVAGPYRVVRLYVHQGGAAKINGRALVSVHQAGAPLLAVHQGGASLITAGDLARIPDEE